MLKKDFDKIYKKLPDSPGIYLFKYGKNLLYVGKATSLRQRVRSYFSNDLIKTRGRLLVDMVTMADKIDFKTTDSVLEALILEAQYIKEHLPKYNTKDKDNKSYNYVVITDEDYPRVLVVRGRNLEQNLEKNLKQNSSDKKGDAKVGEKYKYTFGPYPYGGELKEALNLIRRIFPFRDKCTPLAELKLKAGTTADAVGAITHPRPCFNRSIGLCPGVCTGEISKKDYVTQIKNIKLFFEGKKPALLKSLTKQMQTFAKEKEFEKAGEIKKTIFALNHIQDVSLIKKNDSIDGLQVSQNNKIDGKTVNFTRGGEKSGDKNDDASFFRIEAYDIAHLSGQNMVGVMVVMENGELKPGDYRKFVIKGFEKANDAGALEEVVKRRIAHTEWRTPNAVVLDGNEVQLKRAYDSFGPIAKNISFCSVVKDKTHKAKNILFLNKTVKSAMLVGTPSSSGTSGTSATEFSKEQIVKINAEAHRFAIAFHKNRRAKDFLRNK